MRAQIIHTAAQTLILLFNIYIYMIIARSLCSFFLHPANRFMTVLLKLTEPVIFPFRKLSQRIMYRSRMPLDLSPLFAILCLNILISIVQRVYIALII